MKMPAVKPSDISFKAMIIGAVVDNATTLFLMSLLAALLVSTGLTEDQVMERMRSTSGLLLGLIVGLSCTVLGAFFAGWIAKQQELLHGGLVAVAGMVVTIIFHEGDTRLWFDIVGFSAMLPAGVLGGYLARKRRAQGKGFGPLPGGGA